jgi:hypothetical protein
MKIYKVLCVVIRCIIPQIVEHYFVRQVKVHERNTFGLIVASNVIFVFSFWERYIIHICANILALLNIKPGHGL